MATLARETTPSITTSAPADHAPNTPTSLAANTASTVSIKGASPARVAAPSLTPSPKSLYKTLSPRSSPRPLTGAAALADARRAREQQYTSERGGSTTPNPGAVALSNLMGSQGMSRATEANATSQLSQPLREAADKITLQKNSPRESGPPRTNGASLHPLGVPSNGSNTMTSSAAPRHPSIPQLVEEPEAMDEEDEDEDARERNDDTRPFTYPGPMPTQSQETPSRRDLTYDSGSKGSAKRHKCPYCATDFTRHHNLKSHLLTHSQEKPFVCPTCSARFRRLHDLKRHSKLHTGERPHICPKCGRKFARGDALARHNKGPGGCANRKSSFGAEDGDDGMDDTMDGVEYDNEGDDQEDESEMMDDHGRRVSEPQRKRPRPDSSMDSSRGPYRQQSSTYPPPQMERVMRQDLHPMGPPPSLLSPGSRPSPPDPSFATQHPSDTSHHGPQYPQPSASSYPAPYVTESPRPLSPRTQDQQRLSVGDASALRNRSPSLTSQYQQSPYQRGPAQGMPPQAHMGGHAPQLPSLGSLAAQHGPVQPQTIVAPSYPLPMHGQPHGVSGAPLSHSNPGSHSSHGHSSGGSMRDIIGSEPQDLMAYVRSLEQRFSRMQDEYELRISRLQSDVIELKKQVYKGPI